MRNCFRQQCSDLPQYEGLLGSQQKQRVAALRTYINRVARSRNSCKRSSGTVLRYGCKPWNCQYNNFIFEGYFPMTRVKREHFVPQFHLRKWLVDEKLWVKDLARASEYQEGDLTGVFSARGFYDLEEVDSAAGLFQSTEKSLQRVETQLGDCDRLAQEIAAIRITVWNEEPCETGPACGNLSYNHDR